MKKALKITGITVLILTTFFTLFLVNDVGFAGLSNPSGVSKIYSFGDDYSDSTKGSSISSKLVANSVPDSYQLPADTSNPMYWQGRWSNGTTAVEVLSKSLNVDLTNYAVGGATSGTENYYSWMVDGKHKTGLLGQIEQFKSDLNSANADPNALYFIFASTNDFLKQSDSLNSATPEDIASGTVKNLNSAITSLKELGAKNFLIVNSDDLSKMPWQIITSKDSLAGSYSKSVNTKLAQLIKNYGDSSISLYDYQAISENIRTNTEVHGITQSMRPYQRTYPDFVEGVGNSDTYFYWDEWHPTKAVNKIIGEDMSKQVIATFKK